MSDRSEKILVHSVVSLYGREYLILALALLLILFGQELIGSTRLSLSVDEPIHIALGTTELIVGDYEHMPLHEPPLINQWSALPLLFRSDRPDHREMSH